MREIRTWTTKDSALLYNVAGWSSGYFRINDAGHVEVTPRGPKARAWTSSTSRSTCSAAGSGCRC